MTHSNLEPKSADDFLPCCFTFTATGFTVMHCMYPILWSIVLSPFFLYIDHLLNSPPHCQSLSSSQEWRSPAAETEACKTCASIPFALWNSAGPHEQGHDGLMVRSLGATPPSFSGAMSQHSGTHRTLFMFIKSVFISTFFFTSVFVALCPDFDWILNWVEY